MDDDRFDIGMAREVGQLSFRALSMARDMVRPGVKLLDVAEAVEKFVRDSGFAPAFPLNLSVNREAAHYTPAVIDDRVFGEDDLVKVDFGAAKDGILGDCAVTVDLSGKNTKLVEAAETALQDALSLVKAGAPVGKIGGEIAKAIEGKGFYPVKNLGGHGVEVHALHAEVFIPNYDNGDDTALEEGQVVAIEPFATQNSRGLITESDTCEIYSFVGETRPRMPQSRKVLAKIIESYGSEPFAVRWLSGEADSKFMLYAAIRELVSTGALEGHPMLVDVGGGLVSQAELEVIVQKDGCEILTKK